MSNVKVHAVSKCGNYVVIDADRVKPGMLRSQQGTLQQAIDDEHDDIKILESGRYKGPNPTTHITPVDAFCWVKRADLEATDTPDEFVACLATQVHPDALVDGWLSEMSATRRAKHYNDGDRGREFETDATASELVEAEPTTCWCVARRSSLKTAQVAERYVACRRSDVVEGSEIITYPTTGMANAESVAAALERGDRRPSEFTWRKAPTPSPENPCVARQRDLKSAVVTKLVPPAPVVLPGVSPRVADDLPPMYSDADLRSAARLGACGTADDSTMRADLSAQRFRKDHPQAHEQASAAWSKVLRRKVAEREKRERDDKMIYCDVQEVD